MREIGFGKKFFFVKTLESSGGIDWANSRFMGREREKDC